MVVEIDNFVGGGWRFGFMGFGLLGSLAVMVVVVVGRFVASGSGGLFCG